MSKPNDYDPPKTREPLPPHVAMCPADIRLYWVIHAPQSSPLPTGLMAWSGPWPPKKRRRGK